MKRILTLLLVLIMILFGVVFAVLNAEPVELNYYFGTLHLPLSLVLVAILALGAFLGVFASMSWLLRAKREVARVRRSAALAEKEITNLRSSPIRDRH